MRNLIPIFDLDDTLYCEHDYVRSGFKTVANFIANQYSFVTSDLLYKDFIDVLSSQGRGQIFNIICDKYNIPIDISLLVQVYREHKPELVLYDDAKEALIYFITRSIPIGLITDGDSTTQWRKIESLQLDKLFNVIVVTNDLGIEYWKPSVVPYKKVAKALNVPIGKCVYIGDNPNKDFITAKKLGMKTIRIVREIGDHMKTRLDNIYEADKEIYSLTELLAEWS